MQQYNKDLNSIKKPHLYPLKSPTFPPGKDLIFHNNASLSGAYTAEPIDVRTVGVVASDETGSSISTLVAVLEDKKDDHQSVEWLALV